MSLSGFVSQINLTHHLFSYLPFSVYFHDSDYIVDYCGKMFVTPTRALVSASLRVNSHHVTSSLTPKIKLERPVISPSAACLTGLGLGLSLFSLYQLDS